MGLTQTPVPPMHRYCNVAYSTLKLELPQMNDPSAMLVRRSNRGNAFAANSRCLSQIRKRYVTPPCARHHPSKSDGCGRTNREGDFPRGHSTTVIEGILALSSRLRAGSFAVGWATFNSLAASKFA
jgi:hypothetical protein